MVKIPVYEQKVGMQDSAMGGVSALSAPTRQAPPKESFGTAVAEAQAAQGVAMQGIGKVLLTHAVEMQKQEDQKAVLNADSAYTQAIQDKLQKDILTRRFGSAKGSDLEFSSWAAETQAEIQKGFKRSAQKDMFNNLAIQRTNSARDQVLRHEAEQNVQDTKLSLETQVVANAKAVALDPTPENIALNVKLTQEASKNFNKHMGIVDSKDASGNVIENATVATKENVGKVVASALQVQLDSGDYKSADSILEQYKDQIPADIYTKAKNNIQDKKDFAEHQYIDSPYNRMLWAKYGKNEAAAMKAITGDKAIKNEQLKQYQIRSYSSYVSQMQQAQNVSDENNLKGLYAALKPIQDAARKSGLVYDGYAAAQEVRNRMTFNNPNQAMAADRLIDGMFGKGAVSTNPSAYQQALLDIQNGVITDKWSLMRQYGNQVSFSDIESLDSILVKEDGKYDKIPLATQIKSIADPSDPEEKAMLMDHVATGIKDFVRDNKRQPTSVERLNIIKEKTKQVSIGRGWLGDKTTEAYKVPVGFTKVGSEWINLKTKQKFIPK